MNKIIIKPHSTLIIGLSGGPDSVYLLHQLVALRTEKNLTLIAAHLDHEWRKESGNDAQFCKELCENLQVTCIIKKASDLDFLPKNTGSQEDTGRQLRRYFFEKIREEFNADAITLAHHQDDQLETFFIRIMRGASLEGLCGIKETSNFYIRPLLDTSKKEIIEYVDAHNLCYVTDASNASDNYLRNRIRNKALPALQECDARFTSKCLKIIEHLQEINTFVDEHTKAIYTALTFTKTEDGIQRLDWKKLVALNLYLQKRILQTWLIKHNVQFSPSNSFLEEMLRFISSKKGGSHQLGTSWKIVKKQSHIWIVQQ